MRWLAALGAAVALGAGASPASAAFTGGNGQLVIAPGRGPGLLLISPDGHRARRLCDAPQICGHPLTPRFAANGRQLLFTDHGSGRIEMAAAGGACLWCLNDPPLAPLPGTSASFTPDGRAITFVGRRPDPGLWMFTFATDAAHRLVRLVNGLVCPVMSLNSRSTTPVSRPGTPSIRRRPPVTASRRRDWPKPWAPSTTRAAGQWTPRRKVRAR